MGRFRNFLIVLFILNLGLFLLPKTVFGKVNLGLELPKEEQLTRGQVFEWKVNITVEEETVREEQFYFTYDTNSLELQGFFAGDFFDTVSYNEVEKGKIYVLAESSTPKSGSGTVAVVKMKIIAESPGTAQLCAVLRITPTPTGQPTNVPTPTSFSATATPRPTALPTSGLVNSFFSYAFFGGVFLLLAAMSRMI